MAQGKSKNWTDLISHTLTYFFVFYIASILYYFISDNRSILWFGPITFVCHTITDYFTSRLNSKLWEKKDIHNFFVSVGFDQWLHYVQLFITYYLLLK